MYISLLQFQQLCKRRFKSFNFMGPGRIVITRKEARWDFFNIERSRNWSFTVVNKSLETNWNSLQNVMCDGSLCGGSFWEPVRLGTGWPKICWFLLCRRVLGLLTVAGLCVLLIGVFRWEDGLQNAGSFVYFFQIQFRSKFQYKS